MGLLVVEVLDAVFHLAQKHIGRAQGCGGGLRHEPGLGQARQGADRGAGAQLRKLAAAHHLQQLHRKFNLADAPARELDVVVALGPPGAALGGVVADLAVQHAQGVKHAVVEVTPKHKRHHDGAQLQGQRPLRAARRRHHTAFEPGKTLPLAALRLQIFFECAQRHGRRPRVAVGAQRQIKPKHKAVF